MALAFQTLIIFEGPSKADFADFPHIFEAAQGSFGSLTFQIFACPLITPVASDKLTTDTCVGAAWVF